MHVKILITKTRHDTSQQKNQNMDVNASKYCIMALVQTDLPDTGELR